MWFRERRAELQFGAMSELYGQSKDLPKWISLETSHKALEKDRENPEVNVVLYNDPDMIDERNDFFFETMEEAIQFCIDDYSVSPEAWLDIGFWRNFDDP